MHPDKCLSLPLQKITMRFLVIIILTGAFVVSCNQKDAGKTPALTYNSNDSTQFTNIEWRQQAIDFGKIPEGRKLDIVYHFKNTGTKPLIISKVEPGCGCTVAETPTEPIAPGKEGVIKGSFDSNDRVGTQHKSIYVTANTKGSERHELVFTVEVEKKS
jgi:hypothetical protein